MLHPLWPERRMPTWNRILSSTQIAVTKCFENYIHLQNSITQETATEESPWHENNLHKTVCPVGGSIYVVQVGLMKHMPKCDIATKDM